MDYRIREKIKTWIIFLLVAILFTVLIIKGIRYNIYAEKEEAKNAERINAELEKDTCRTEEEIYNRLEKAIMDNTQDNVYIRVPATYSQEDLTEIAKKIDPFLGHVTQTTYATSTQRDGDGPEIKDEYAGINYKYVKNDDYYVYEELIEGKDIPAEQTKATQLKNVCEKFLNENINSSMSEYDKELAIHDYIVNGCTYGFSDAKDDTEFEAYGALVNHKAVCEGYAEATYLLLKLCNIESKLIEGHTNSKNAADSSNPDGGGTDGVLETDSGKKIDGHMWNQVLIDGSWYHLDTTWDDPISSTPTLEHTYFNVNDMIIGKNHEWDKSTAQSCTSMTSNYYEKNDKYFLEDTSFKNYVKEVLAGGSREPITCAVANADLSQEAMYFIFDYDGISNYIIYKNGVDGFMIVRLEFNQQ